MYRVTVANWQESTAKEIWKKYFNDPRLTFQEQTIENGPLFFPCHVCIIIYRFSWILYLGCRQCSDLRLVLEHSGKIPFWYLHFSFSSKIYWTLDRVVVCLTGIYFLEVYYQELILSFRWKFCWFFYFSSFCGFCKLMLVLSWFLELELPRG